MTTAMESMYRYKKANKLVRLTFKKNGPKSYKRGQGTLLATLAQQDGATQRELTKKINVNRSTLKDIVKKAERNGYVAFVDAEDGKSAYAVKLTDLGREIAQKRIAAQEAVAESVLSALTPEERTQLDAINEKLIVSLKEKGISAKRKGYKHTKKHHRHHR
jgi:DNA-binding MarR family transcriptional regulator